MWLNVTFVHALPSPAKLYLDIFYKLIRSPRENVGGQDTQKDLHSKTGRYEKKGKTQEKMERGSRNRSSSAGSEKMERVGGR